MSLPYYATPDTHTIAASTIQRATDLRPADTLWGGDGWYIVTSTMPAAKADHTVILLDGGDFRTVPNDTLYHVSDVVELHEYIATITHPFYGEGSTMTVMAPFTGRAKELIIGGVKGVDTENWSDTVGGFSMGENHYTVPRG